MTRAHLEAAGHPTDQYSIAPAELDISCSPEKSGITRDKNIWYENIKSSTEPLTKDRIAAELLHAVTGVLTNFDDDEMDIISRAMKFFNFFQMVDGLNDVAMQGKAAQDARAKGPQAKRERSLILRALIRSRAEKLWMTNPTLRREYHNTAKKIFDDVNHAKLEMALGSKPLSVKTISDHLRAVFSGSNTEDELSSV